MRDQQTVSNAARRHALSRRTFLHGVGVTMALPWMESIRVWGATPAAAVSAGGSALGPIAGEFPKRFAVLFMGNGINGNHWWARGEGAEMMLGKSLGPMESLKTKMNFITGLYNEPAVGVGIHPGQTGNILSGVPLQKGAVLRGGVSMDQMLAQRIGQETMQPSLVLGCEQPNTGYHETNFSMAYSSHISWQSADTPVPMEVYPSLAFDSLFENRGNLRNKSVLDRVMDQANDLSTQVSANDKAKLDEYLNSVREVEKHIQRMRTQKDKAEERGRDRGQNFVMMDRPQNGLPEDLRDHMRLMGDIVALAFQTDRTRVASLLLCRDLSGLFYPFLDVRDAHHPASHNDLSDGYERISRYYCSQLAYLATKLDAMHEGEGTVLDHSCLMFLSNMWSGYKHDNTKLPILTVGGLGGTLETGRVMDYFDRGNDNRRVCSLYLSLMDRMGVSLERFGDSDQRLADI